jgi:arginyl-tRNA synthetase
MSHCRGSDVVKMIGRRIFTSLKFSQRKISNAPQRPLDIRSILQDRISTAIIASYGQEIVSTIKIQVTALANEDYGHYQCIAAMPLAKQLKMKPHDVANQIFQNLESNGLISSTEVAGPGFMNFRSNSASFMPIFLIFLIDCLQNL